MAIKVARSPIAEVTAYFTFVLNVQTVQLVEPIWYRFAVPTKRHIFGIVNGRIAINFLSLSITLRVHGFLLQLSLLRYNGWKKGTGRTDGARCAKRARKCKIGGNLLKLLVRKSEFLLCEILGGVDHRLEMLCQCGNALLQNKNPAMAGHARSISSPCDKGGSSFLVPLS